MAHLRKAEVKMVSKKLANLYLFSVNLNSWSHSEDAKLVAL